jgi:hypothetical protein
MSVTGNSDPVWVCADTPRLAYEPPLNLCVPPVLGKFAGTVPRPTFPDGVASAALKSTAER